MDSDFLPGMAEHLTRVSERHWHALADDCVVGRGEVAHRPDGRAFLSIDAWHDGVFRRLAAAMLAALHRPLYTVVDEADLELLMRWERAGFGPRRREWEYALPTTGPDPAPPPGVTILAAGQAAAEPLGDLDLALRAEIQPWSDLPAEVLTRPDALDPARYVVAADRGRYVGLARVAPLPRRPHLGLIAVRHTHRRRGIARALLAEVLAAAHRRGVAAVSADVNQANTAALALVESFGARRVGSNLELVLR